MSDDHGHSAEEAQQFDATQLALHEMPLSLRDLIFRRELQQDEAWPEGNEPAAKITSLWSTPFQKEQNTQCARNNSCQTRHYAYLTSARSSLT
jgi:hypothetical protein